MKGSCNTGITCLAWNVAQGIIITFCLGRANRTVIKNERHTLDVASCTMTQHITARNTAHDRTFNA